MWIEFLRHPALRRNPGGAVDSRHHGQLSHSRAKRSAVGPWEVQLLVGVNMSVDFFHR